MLCKVKWSSGYWGGSCQAELMVTPSVEEFLDQRPRLFGLAYRMLGEAEDVVQDAYLCWAGAAHAEIAYPQPF